MNNQTDKLLDILTRLKTDPNAVPSENFRTNARIRILNTMAKEQMTARPSARHALWLSFAFRFAVIVLLFTAGTVYTAQYSSPSDALFPIKVLSERIALTLSPNQSMKTDVANSIINRRGTEIKQAQMTGNAEEIQKTIETFRSTVKEIRNTSEVSHDQIETEINKFETQIHTTEDNIEHQDSKDHTILQNIKGDSIIISPTPTVKNTENNTLISPTPKPTEYQKSESFEHISPSPTLIPIDQIHILEPSNTPHPTSEEK